MLGVDATELVAIALRRLANGRPSELARVLKLREISDAADVSKQVARWRDGDSKPRYEATVRLLDALGAISWDALRDPAEPDAGRAVQAEILRKAEASGEKARQAQEAEPPSARRRLRRGAG